MEKEMLALLTDLHITNDRQGPGSEKSFGCALELSGLNKKASLSIADIGSGTGSSTIPLLQKTNASVVAVELIPAFLEELEKKAKEAGVGDRVTTVEADMSTLPFEKEQFDAIWSEGAIYNIGFAKGVRQWREYLKPGGLLIASEITWLQKKVPEELRSHWEGEYAEIDMPSKKLNDLEEAGYSPVAYFMLPEECWLTEYYEPLEAGFAHFLERHKESALAKSIVEEEQKEIELYKKYKEFYSYGMYIARKV